MEIKYTTLAEMIDGIYVFSDNGEYNYTFTDSSGHEVKVRGCETYDIIAISFNYPGLPADPILINKSYFKEFCDKINYVGTNLNKICEIMEKKC
jgi:hypothetical protein